MTTLMDGFGFMLIVGLLFFPVFYLAGYFVYAAFAWRKILVDWSFTGQSQPERRVESIVQPKESVPSLKKAS